MSHCSGRHLVILLAAGMLRAHAGVDTVVSVMVLVDVLAEAAAGLYAAHGFTRLPESLRPVLPMRVVGGR